MPSSSGTASAGAAPSPSPAGPRPISPTLSFASSSNRAPLPSSSSSSYFEEGRLTPSAQRAQSPTIDESAAAYFFVQQLQRHQQLQQQQQQQQQQRLYASAPSSPGLHPLRPPSRPASRSGSSRPARSRSGSNASSTSLHSLSFSSHQHSPSSSFHNLPSTLFPLTPLPPSVHQQQQQQHLPPPLPLTLHDDLPPSYSAATASVPAVGIPSSSTVPPPHSATRSSTDEVFFGTPASASASVSRLGSGASTPSAQNPSSSRRGSSHHQQFRSQPQSNVGSPHPDSGRRHHHTADSTFQERARRNQQTPSSASSSSQWTPRGSRPGSSNGRQQQLRLSVPVFGSSAMNLAGQSSGSVNGTVHASTSTGTSVSARDSGSGNGNGRRRLQSRSEVDLSHMGRYRGLTGPSQQHIQQQEQQEGQQNGGGLRYRQRASTSGAPRPLSGTFQDASMDTARPQPPQTPIRAREGEEERTRARSRSGRQSSRRGVRSPTPTPTTTSPTPSHLLVLRLLLRILLAPIWLFTSIPHPSSSSVDDNNDEQQQQPWGWGVRMVLFPLRLFAAVPGCVGSFWLLRNMWVGLGLDGISVWDGGRGKGTGTGMGRIAGGGGDRKDHPTAVVFAVASLWSLSTAYYALSLTTLLLRRWLLYYSLLSSIIRLVALQAICWPLVRITLFVFGPTRPLEAWILIASTTTFSDTIARWLVSNIVEGGEGLGAWVGGGGEDGDGVFWSGTPRASPRRVVVGDEGGKVEGEVSRRRRRRSRSRSGRGRRKTTGEVGPPPLLGGTTDVDDGIEAELCMSPTEREVVKDTTDDGSGSDSSAWGANFHRRRRRRRQQGDHEEIATAASSPRRAASFPRLPTSDLLSLDIGDDPSLLCGSTGGMMEPGATILRPRSLVSAFSASSFSSSSSASLSTSSSSSSTCSSEGEGDVGGGGGEEVAEGEGFVSVDLRVRRVFHWDVAIKRNILPMGVLAYASLWVLLASSKVEGRGR